MVEGGPTPGQAGPQLPGGQMEAHIHQLPGETGQERALQSPKAQVSVPAMSSSPPSPSQIQHVLGCLERFFCEIEPEVESISGEESGTQAFMHLMAVFNKVNTQQVEMDTKFGALHRAVLMLDKFGHPLSPTAREQFNTAPQR